MTVQNFKLKRKQKAMLKFLFNFLVVGIGLKFLPACFKDLHEVNCADTLNSFLQNKGFICF